MTEPSRLEDEDHLHPTRRRILTFIRRKPGHNLRQVCDATRINRGTATYHLGALEKMQAVTSVRVGRERLLFAASKVFAAERIESILHGPTRAIAMAVAERPGAIQRNLTDHLDVSRRTFRRHIDRLVDHGLVEESSHGRVRQYAPTGRLERILEREQQPLPMIQGTV